MSVSTPFLSSLKKSGGSLYTFSGANKDLSRTFSNDGKYQFKFSKFVCLNLPDIYTPTNNSTNQKINSINLTGLNDYANQYSAYARKVSSGKDSDSESLNQTIAEYLQNYEYNFEELMKANKDTLTSLTNTTYNSDIHTPSERIFFKLLNKLGVLRFVNTENDYVLNKHIKSTGLSDEFRFVEYSETEEGRQHEDISQNKYNRVVQYIGDIDMINSVELNNDAYSEIYLNIPTQVGNTPHILFKQEYDDEFTSGEEVKFVIDSEFSNDGDYITGVDKNNNTFINFGEKDSNEDDSLDEYAYNTITNLSVNAFYDGYDKDNKVPFYQIGDKINDAKGDIEWLSETYSFNNQTLTKHSSNVDGIGVDFDASSYYDITNNTEDDINTIMEYNGSNYSSSFEFNAVLIYYDITDTTTEKTATNLYGVLFLEEVTDISDNDEGLIGYIQRYPKYKLNDLTNNNGNSFSLRINIKIDAEPNSTGVNTVINDYNTFSMGIYSEAMAKLQAAISLFNSQEIEIDALQTELEDVKSYITSSLTIDELSEQLGNLQKDVDNYSLSANSANTLLNIVSSVQKEIQDIEAGNTNAKITYDSNIFEGGKGISITNGSSEIKKIITNTASNGVIGDGMSYSIANSSTNDTSNILIEASLTDFDNILPINITAGTEHLIGSNGFKRNFEINLNETDKCIWETGKKIRITFPNKILIDKTQSDYSILITSEHTINSETIKLNYKIPVANIQCDNPIIEVTYLGDYICTQYISSLISSNNYNGNYSNGFLIDVINPTYIDSNDDSTSSTKLIKSNVTYKEITNAIDANNLIVGNTYIITDYNLPTFKNDSPIQSASGSVTPKVKLDIFVKALSDNLIDSDAIAYGYTLDANGKKAYNNRYKIKYYLNKTDSSGITTIPSDSSDIFKQFGQYSDYTQNGIIYYMEDLNGNSAPWDFKNILFKLNYTSITKANVSNFIKDTLTTTSNTVKEYSYNSIMGNEINHYENLPVVPYNLQDSNITNNINYTIGGIDALNVDDNNLYYTFSNDYTDSSSEIIEDGTNDGYFKNCKILDSSYNCCIINSAFGNKKTSLATSISNIVINNSTNCFILTSKTITNINVSNSQYVYIIDSDKININGTYDFGNKQILISNSTNINIGDNCEHIMIVEPDDYNKYLEDNYIDIKDDNGNILLWGYVGNIEINRNASEASNADINNYLVLVSASHENKLANIEYNKLTPDSKSILILPIKYNEENQTILDLINYFSTGENNNDVKKHRKKYISNTYATIDSLMNGDNTIDINVIKSNTNIEVPVSTDYNYADKTNALGDIDSIIELVNSKVTEIEKTNVLANTDYL